MHDFYIVFEATGGVMSFRRIGALGGAMALVMIAPGCSFIFTRGPPPTPPPGRDGGRSRTAPPDCTSSVAAPVVDTVLGTASVALVVAGVAGATYKDPPCRTGEWFCGFGNGWTQAAGAGAIIVGTLTGALFIASAAVGYTRTAACRAAVESRAPRSPSPRPFALSAPPGEACPMGDAPRLCRREARWPASEASGLGAPQ